MEALERSLCVLEEMLREVESVSTVIEFDEGLLNDRPTDKGAVRIASNGVARLAAEAGEDLRTWRAQQEAEHDARNQELMQRLRESISRKREEETDREGVRHVVRARLCEHARHALERGVAHHAKHLKAAALEEAKRSKATAIPSESAGAEALSRLKAQLDLIVSPVEALRAEKPPEMLRAIAAATKALQRKQQRMPEQRVRLLDATGHVDAELLSQADKTAAARKVALSEQSKRQTDVLALLREALAERHKLFEDLDAAARAGPPLVESGVWAVLFPGSDLVAVPQQETPDKEQMRRMLLQRGEERIDVLVRDFQQKHLQAAPSTRAMNADGELEEWKVKAHQELLEGVRSNAELCHREVLRFLKDTLVSSESVSLDQLSGAIAAAEQFKRTRTESVAEQCRTAEQSMARFSEEHLEQVRSRRRRVEMCALKRWGDIKEHLDGLTAAADASGLLAIGEAAQRCVAECHEVIKMPSVGRELRALDRPLAAEELVATWDRYEVSTGDRFDFVCNVLEVLPDSPETCAVARGILCLLDDELKRQIKPLRERLSKLETSLGAAQEFE